MINCRKEVIKLLDKTFSKGSYSNILLDSVLSENEISQQERKFITTLYYGVLERKITLDYIISLYCTKGLNKLDVTILNILRAGIYQIKYMNSVPDNAAVNESVKLVRAFRLSSASGFVNAVLRHFIRDNGEISYPEDINKMLSVKYSLNIQIVQMIVSGYGEEFAQAFMARSLERTPVYLRMNNVISDEKTFTDSLGKISVKKNEKLPYCYQVDSGNLTASDAFKKGYFHVQDIASQLACTALSPSENDTVLDLCSAPGGKAFTLAEMMNGKGKVIASDIYPKRVDLIRDGAKRLRLDNITAVTCDAAVRNNDFEGADKVLCDVPCSGTGVIRKKPEIRYKKADDFSQLPELQYTILQNAASYLKVGGELVYSTCTLNRKENDEVIDRFLSRHSEFEGVSFMEEYGDPFGGYKVTLGADSLDSDGFFISKIKRKE